MATRKPAVGFTSWYGKYIPLFIGFQHHPRWWSPDFEKPSTVSTTSIHKNIVVNQLVSGSFSEELLKEPQPTTFNDQLVVEPGFEVKPREKRGLWTMNLGDSAFRIRKKTTQTPSHREGQARKPQVANTCGWCHVNDHLESLTLSLRPYNT